MTMMNRDVATATTNAAVMQMATALQANDADGAAKAFAAMQAQIAERIEAEFDQLKGAQDSAALAQMGYVQLTSDETKWCNDFAAAVKSGAKQAITGLTATIPYTILDRTFESLKKDHPLLEKVGIVNAGGQLKVLINGAQVSGSGATWGALGAGITAQLTGKLELVDATSAKLTCYLPVAKDFVNFAFGASATYVEKYVRTCLEESMAYGLENGIINGSGASGQPAGMVKVRAHDTGNISAKSETAITTWDANNGAGYADVVAGMMTDDNGDPIAASEVVLVVNPADFVKKIRPAQNTITHAGIVDTISLVYPTSVVVSPKVASGKAIAFVPGSYFFAIGGGTSGKIEYSDEAQYLDDVRVYTSRIYGCGMPVNNNGIAYLNIANLEAPALPVKVKGTVKTQTASE